MALTKLTENLELIVDKGYKRKNFLNESDNIVIYEDTEYKARAIYEFNVWELDKLNGNGRKYSTALAKKVVTENRPILGYTNHNEKVDVTRQYAVLRNWRISEGWLRCDAYLIGQYGGEMLETLEAGGPVGVSTTGNGEVREKEVVVDTYLLESLDWVDRPSNRTYHTGENKKESKEDISTEKVKECETLNEKSSGIDKATMKNFNKNMEGWIKDALSIKIIEDKEKTLTELKEYFYYNTDKTLKFGGELLNQINNELEQIKKQKDNIFQEGKRADELKQAKTTLITELTEKELIIKSLQTELSDIKEKNTELEKVTKDLSDAVEDLGKENNESIPKNIYETVLNNSLKNEKELNTLIENYNLLVSTYTSLKETHFDLVNDIETTKKNNELKVKLEKEKNDRAEQARKDLEEKAIEDISKTLIENEKKLAKDILDKRANEKAIKESATLAPDLIRKKQVTEFYKSKLTFMPGLSKYKEEFDECETIEKAQYTYQRLQAEHGVSLYERKTSIFNSKSLDKTTKDSVKQVSRFSF